MNTKEIYLTIQRIPTESAKINYYEEFFSNFLNDITLPDRLRESLKLKFSENHDTFEI